MLGFAWFRHFVAAISFAILFLPVQLGKKLTGLIS